MNERSIFLAALDIDDPCRRDAYVLRACGTDKLLRIRVATLLEAHDEPAGFMQRPARDLVTGLEERAVAEGPGTVIGGYKLLEQIGEGGFGVVYMAEQSRPVVRRVALKILKPGMDTRQVIARFEAERQALALMDHPHIAQVFDGGETASGRPYFVMELVRGVPITQFCDENELLLCDRLELFVDVCHAVQHAHQKGIIHRDLKPSNVLITQHDDKAVVKVIDFGIAKATGQRLTDKTLFTSFVQMIGTPLYMSPEQAQMSGLDVDTRSDIYSLGVLLYELLTGTTPFDSQRLTAASYDEVRRIIVEEEPPKPSTRISRLKTVRSTPPATRRSDAHERSRPLRGELDWLVMKCLEKDRNRRYATANGLAADVERYLKHEPVHACPPSQWYRFRKLVRRNRGPFLAAAAVVLVMLAGIVTLLTSNILIRQEQTRTQVEKRRAEEAETLALNRAGEIIAGMERLKEANELVEMAHFFIGERRWDTAALAFTQAIELRREHGPAWEGRGSLYASLGLWELAAEDFAQAARRQEPVTGNRWFLLALSRAYVGDVAGYRAACARMSDLFQGTTVSYFAMDMVRANALASTSPAEPRRLVAVAEAIVSANPRVPWFVHVLGAAHYRAGEYKEAVRRLEESLASDHKWSARAINYPFLAMAYYRLGRREEAREALSKAEEAIGEWTTARFEAGGRSYWVVSQGSTDFWPVFWWDWMNCQLTCAEARRVMGLAPASEDLRLRAQRARSFAGLRRPEMALQEYAHALAASPDDKQMRLESHRTRGFWRASLGHWKEAAAEYARASDLQPDEPYFWWYQAILHLAVADEESYRRVSTAMFDRFRTTDDPRTAHSVVSACTLLPDALPDMEVLISIGQVASHWYAGSIRMLAAAQCRADACEDAVRNFQQAAVHYRLRAEDWLLLALAHHKLGQTQEAQQCLDSALEWIDRAGRRPLNDPAGTQPGWGDWHEQIWVPILRQEIETLLARAAWMAPGQAKKE